MPNHSPSSGRGRGAHPKGRNGARDERSGGAAQRLDAKVGAEPPSAGLWKVQAGEIAHRQAPQRFVSPCGIARDCSAMRDFVQDDFHAVRFHTTLDHLVEYGVGKHPGLNLALQNSVGKTPQDESPGKLSQPRSIIE